jgi:uncharacterized short protein YbdD (DUF466 family)
MRCAEEKLANMQGNASSHFVFRISAVAISRLARAAWQSLREWSGDAAYDRYLLIAAARPGAAPPLPPAEFYVEQLNRRYSKPTRCC